MVGKHKRYAQRGLVMMALGGMMAVSAAELPPRQPGLWKQIHYEGKQIREPDVVMYQCVDESSDKALRDAAMGMHGGVCQEEEIKRQGNTLVGRNVCQISGSKVTTDYVVSGNLKTEYRVDSRSRNVPPLFGEAESESVILAEWQGACKPGQKPGDMMFEEDGEVRTVSMEDLGNMRDMANMMEQMQSQQGMGQLMEQLRGGQSPDVGGGNMQDIGKMMEQLQRMQQQLQR